MRYKTKQHLLNSGISYIFNNNTLGIQIATNVLIYVSILALVCTSRKFICTYKFTDLSVSLYVGVV